MTYLVIRPEGKCQDTCQFLQESGIDCVGYPLMSLQPVPGYQHRLQQALESVEKGDWIIVTSTKAAELAESILLDAKTARLLEGVRLFAIGKSTAKILPKGYAVAFPKTETSEGLLTLLQEEKEFSKLSKNIIILKGEGGRSFLQSSLCQTSNGVTECNLYRRKITRPTTKVLDWGKTQVSCVIATSGELITAAFEQLDAERLRKLPWIVVSKRMATIAKGYGITNIFISEAANKTALKNAATRFPEGKHD